MTIEFLVLVVEAGVVDSEVARLLPPIRRLARYLALPFFFDR